MQSIHNQETTNHTPKKEKKSRATEREQLEVLAYLLFAGEAPENSDPIEEWRRNSECRENWKHRATLHIARLEEVGLKIEPKDSAKIRRKVDDLITIPAQIAYTL